MNIPDEAVEAAYEALPIDSYIAGLSHVRAMLEAAAPFLMAQAWDEGRKHGARYPYGERGLATDDNHYRKDTK
jgi:hypothetical protein